jgi:cell pole-organizing protein PopZ
MSEQNAPEPTMEEILASIRRIISEDEPPADGAAPEPEPEPEAAHEPEPAAFALPDIAEEAHDTHGAHEAHEDVLELTEPVDGPPVETLGDLDLMAQPAPAPAKPAALPRPAPVEGPLVGDEAAASAAASFNQLGAHLLMPAEGRTLEDVVRELLRPLLKSWLDANLPQIVQAKVDQEVERIARGRGL